MERRTAMKSAADIEQAAAEWLVRREGDAWSDTAQTAFDQWVAEKPAHRIAVIRLDTLWRKPGRLRAPVLRSGDPEAQQPVRANTASPPHQPLPLTYPMTHYFFSRGT